MNSETLSRIAELTSIPTKLSGSNCPKCQSPHTIKNGKNKGIQCYKCKTCNAHYRSTTKTSIHGIHNKLLINKYITCMQKSMSLRATAKAVGISLGTAFAWRHKILAVFTDPHDQHCKAITVSNIIMPYSEKGTKHKTQSNKPAVHSAIITDQKGNISITKIDHARKKLQIAKLIHATKATSISQEIKIENPTQPVAQSHLPLNWLSTFRGVATKYLQHYWSWYTAIEKLQNRTDKFIQFRYKALEIHN